MSAFDLAVYLREFREEAERRGFIEEVLLETTAGPLVAWVSPAGGGRGYLSAGIHGDEPAGPLAALELLKAGDLDDGWLVCPALNPTGLVAGTRDSADGLDLNRDYKLCHSAEVRAHIGWLTKWPVPPLFVSLHEDWETTGFYFYEINLGEDRPDRAAAILGAVSPWFPPEPSANIDDHDTRSPGWIYHEARPDMPDHWPEAIYLSELGCPVSFTLETPSSCGLEERTAAHVAGARAAMGAG